MIRSGAAWQRKSLKCLFPVISLSLSHRYIAQYPTYMTKLRNQFFVVQENESQLPSCHQKINQFTVGEQCLGGHTSMSQSELVDQGKIRTGGDPVFLFLHSLKNGVYS